MTNTYRSVEDYVREFEDWMSKESDETGGEIGQSDLSDKFRELLQSLLKECVEQTNKEIPEDPEAFGWDAVFPAEYRCCPGDDFGEGYIRGLKKAAQIINSKIQE